MALTEIQETLRFICEQQNLKDFEKIMNNGDVEKEMFQIQDLCFKYHLTNVRKSINDVQNLITSAQVIQLSLSNPVRMSLNYLHRNLDSDDVRKLEDNLTQCKGATLQRGLKAVDELLKDILHNNRNPFAKNVTSQNLTNSTEMDAAAQDFVQEKQVTDSAQDLHDMNSFLLDSDSESIESSLVEEALDNEEMLHSSEFQDGVTELQDECKEDTVMNDQMVEHDSQRLESQDDCQEDIEMKNHNVKNDLVKPEAALNEFGQHEDLENVLLEPVQHKDGFDDCEEIEFSEDDCSTVESECSTSSYAQSFVLDQGGYKPLISPQYFNAFEKVSKQENDIDELTKVERKKGINANRNGDQRELKAQTEHRTRSVSQMHQKKVDCRGTQTKQTAQDFLAIGKRQAGI